VPAPTLLVIDDDDASRRLIAAICAGDNIEVRAALDGKSGLAVAQREPIDVVILDLGLPDMNGIEVLERLRAAHPHVPVVMLTANTEIKSAVRATQLGAFDYLTKPIDPEHIALVVRRALETHALRVEVHALRKQVGDGGSLATKMGPSREIALIAEQVRIVASTEFSVLIVGETGAGKELVAQAVHRSSERRDHPFIAIDCGAIPEALLESELFGHEKGAFTGAERRKQGRFELAAGGTIFLDEIGNLPSTLQAKLLRVLESRQLQAVGAAKSKLVDARFVAATNEDLQQRIADGRFRADLYFRLAQYTIALPPLRARASDIAHLAQLFVEEVSVELRRPVQAIAPEALALLQRHKWPGNVRELRNVIRQAVLESKEMTLRRNHVQKALGKEVGSAASSASASTAGRSLREIASSAAREAERQAITEVLRASQGNKSQAARLLQTDYKTLHVKIGQLGIRARDFRP
jgi:DNA-binding NtrC family response regulator